MAYSGMSSQAHIAEKKDEESSSVAIETYWYNMQVRTCTDNPYKIVELTMPGVTSCLNMVGQFHIRCCMGDWMYVTTLGLFVGTGDYTVLGYS